MRHYLLPALVVVALSSCDNAVPESSQESVEGIQTQPTVPEPPRPDSLGLIVLIDHVREGTTVDDWIATNPEDASLFVASDPAYEGPWCQRTSATVQHLPAGDSLVTTLRFYVPPFTVEPGEPPEEVEASEGSCQLGWVRTIVALDGPAEAAITAVRGTLESALGVGAPVGPGEPHSDFRLDVTGSDLTRWTQGDITVLSRSAVLGGRGYSEVWAFRPSSPGFDRGLDLAEDWEAAFRERAITLAELDSATLALVDHARTNDGPFSSPQRRGSRAAAPDPAPLLGAVRELVSVTAASASDATVASSEQEAARMVVADLLVLERAPYIDMGRDETTPLTDSLAVLGARYGFDWREGAWVYSRSLLGSAIDRSVLPGGIGDMAEELALERPCSHGLGPREVIDATARLLERATDPAFKARLHYLLGTAHTTIVGLSQGYDEHVAPSYSPEDYSADAPASRLEALRHLGEAMAGDLDPILKLGAWTTWWRLSADMPVPMRVCVWD